MQRKPIGSGHRRHARHKVVGHERSQHDRPLAGGRLGGRIPVKVHRYQDDRHLRNLAHALVLQQNLKKNTF